MGERADAVPDIPAAAMRGFLMSFADYVIRHKGEPIDYDRWTAAAAPLLPGGGEAERLREIERAARIYFREFDHLVGDRQYPERVDLRRALDARPDAERAPQWADPMDKMTAGEMPRLAEWKNAEPRPQGDEVETAERLRAEIHRREGVMISLPTALDALDARSGADTDHWPLKWGYWTLVRTDPAPNGVIPSEIEVRGRGVIGRGDSVQVIERGIHERLLLDARSGADTVKLAEVERTQEIIDYLVAIDMKVAAARVATRFASGADRPEGS